ncbi:hypothetical protein [Methylorubrum salsuginis]|uniref:Uncharacterized protein n=1 Tax=Methylorubrum salsuginis TaxID=414703 RepID=A0A1I4AI16_9HYPH|nr:hypothetical protein [Methylorubrum salsuginis]SFK55913.1 hypothetical protein SAMN04488125_102402 [Methylorubrum salsuginis]
MTASPEPARLLRLPPQRQGWLAVFWVLFGAASLGGMLVACALYTAPVVISDWQVRETARPVAEARIGDATCKSKIVIHICDLTLTLRRPAGTVTRRVNYVFSGVQVGDFSVSPMADPARPDRITTDLGLDRLWNRTVTLLVIMAALAAAVVGALVSLLRNRRAGSVTAG